LRLPPGLVARRARWIRPEQPGGTPDSVAASSGCWGLRQAASSIFAGLGIETASIPFPWLQTREALMPDTTGTYEIEARRCARDAGLRYITDQTPGYYRRV